MYTHMFVIKAFSDSHLYIKDSESWKSTQEWLCSIYMSLYKILAPKNSQRRQRYEKNVFPVTLVFRICTKYGLK